MGFVSLLGLSPIGRNRAEFATNPGVVDVAIRYLRREKREICAPRRRNRTEFAANPGVVDANFCANPNRTLGYQPWDTVTRKCLRTFASFSVIHEIHSQIIQESLIRARECVGMHLCGNPAQGRGARGSFGCEMI